MKDSVALRRAKKMQALKDELTQWQQAVVNQEIRIDRLECTLSALVTTLNAQKRFEKFEVNKLNATLDQIVKARKEAMQKKQESATAQVNGHAHAPQESHAHSDQG